MHPSNLLVSVQGIRAEALVDTGASISIIHTDLCSRLRKVRTPYVGPSLHGANETAIKPVALVEKDGSVRFCVDYRALNKITQKDVYPMPRIDDALDCLQGAEYFSSLDLRSSYWQIPLRESEKEKTAFATPDGLYEFNVMEFGVCNAPATFEQMLETALRSLKWKTCFCYLDDIVIFLSTFFLQTSEAPG